MHESVELPGAPGQLRNDLQHYAYRDLSHHLATIDRYTTLAAEQAFAEGKRSSALAAYVHAKLAFLRNFVLRHGFTDGGVGLIVSTLNAYYVFLKLAKLVELQRGQGPAAGATPGPGA